MHLRMSTSYTDDVIAVQYISGSRKVGCHFQSSVHPNQTILSPSKSEPSTCIQWSMYWILITNIILMSCQRCWRLVSRRQCIKYLYEWCVFPNDANCEWSSIESRDHFSCVTFADYIHPFYSFKGSFVPALPSVNQNNSDSIKRKKETIVESHQWGLKNDTSNRVDIPHNQAPPNWPFRVLVLWRLSCKHISNVMIKATYLIILL